MDWDYWQIILLTFIGSSSLTAIILTLKETWLLWLRKRFNNLEEKSKQFMINRSKVQDLLEDLRNKIHCPRALILYTEDSGGLPTLGSQLYISILYESSDSDIPNIKSDVQHLMTDGHYDSLLSELLAEGSYHGVTSDMPDGLLKDFYVASGICESLVLPILQTKSKFYYLSVAWNTCDNVNEGKIYAKSAANNIKELLIKNM